MSFNKIIMFATVSFSMIAIMTGCNDIATEDEIMQYAKTQYGNASLIYSETINDSERVCHFKDELGFEYDITSYLWNANIDGSGFGTFENKSSTYDESYSEWLIDNIYERYNMTEYKNCLIELHDDTIIFELLVSDKDAESLTVSDDIIIQIEAVADILKESDIKKLYVSDILNVYAGNERIGSVDMTYTDFRDVETEDVLFYEDKLKEYSNFDKDIEYLKSEHKAYSDFSDISDYTRYQVLGSPDYETEGINVYYYKYPDGSEHFITDYPVYNKNSYNNDFVYYNDILF